MAKTFGRVCACAFVCGICLPHAASGRAAAGCRLAACASVVLAKQAMQPQPQPQPQPQLWLNPKPPPPKPKPPPPVLPLFKLKANSKFKNPSEPQAQALEAILATKKNGIVVLPCGSGKTCVFIQAALKAGNRVLFLNYEKQGVVQVADAIREHTTVQEGQLCAYSSECKTEPNVLMCYMVTTYSMFSTTSNRSDATKRVRNFVKQTDWDLVVLDECHHAWAETFRDLVEVLVAKSHRVLGFTGTLCRSETFVLGDNAEALTRQEANERQFDFIGPVLYSRTCAELEAAGLIAKVRRIEVRVRMTPNFLLAHERVQGPLKQYVQALNPDKLNAVWMLVQLHRALGNVGMIFCNHLLPAKTLKAFLGPRWEVLSGGNAHGTEGMHTAQANAELVKRFNAGSLDGLIATPVGESALDVFNTRFRYAIVVDAHGGQAPASQKLGRLSRTPRVLANPGESPEDLKARIQDEQKEASYYEIVTANTEEETAARARDVQFLHDGYSATPMEFDKLRDAAARVNILEANAPFFTPTAQLRLLVDCLSYQDLGNVECAGNVKANEAMQPHRNHVKSLRNKVGTTKNSLFKQRHQKTLERVRSKLPERKEEALAAKRDVLNNATLPEVAARVLRLLDLDADLLAAAGIDLPPPPEDHDQEDEFLED